MACHGQDREESRRKGVLGDEVILIRSNSLGSFGGGVE
jgi:hypothetical protein